MKWLFAARLVLQARFGASYVVPLGRETQATFSGQGIEVVVLAGVASEARKHSHPRRELGLLTSTTDSPEPASLTARYRPSPPPFSTA